MQILNLLTVLISRLLDKIERIVGIIERKSIQYLYYINADMDQEEDQQQEQRAPVAEQQELVDELEELDQYEPMEEDLSDSDIDDEANGDEEDDEDDVNYEIISSDEDFDEMISSYDSDSETTSHLKQLHRFFMERRQAQSGNMYTFKPLRLIKCNYKTRCTPGEYPQARSGHRVIASESHLYSLGGYNPSSALRAARRGACMLFQELWAYNFATNSWKLLLDGGNSEMPRELASNALAIHNNTLISHGGTGYPFGETCSNDCYVYTTGDKPQVIRLDVTGDLPTAQYGPGIVIHKDYLYTIGGTTGFDYSCDVYRLNLVTKVWENVYICRPEMRDDPEGRYRHEVVYDGRHIYVLGGGTSHSVYDLQRIPAFNLETNRWDYFDTIPDRTASTSQEAGFPKARKCLSCVQHTASNGDIEAFITGGLQGDFTTYFNDIWKLNLRTKCWKKIHTASLPRPLYFHSAAHAGNGCMYIFGGIEYNEKDMSRRNNLFKMWMTIPKLSDICWDAITYYNRNLFKYDRDTLLQAGIPERFVCRLPLSQRLQSNGEKEVPSLAAIINRQMRRQSE